MADGGSLARFTREISIDGLLEHVLDQAAPEDVPALLATVALDRGYLIEPADLAVYLSGLDVRFA